MLEGLVKNLKDKLKEAKAENVMLNRVFENVDSDMCPEGDNNCRDYDSCLQCWLNTIRAEAEKESK